ncbi:BnaCnng17480D [Brassica napus]|uniref:BnaCnng17480D protein n=1 Tax=Brassica napus TaxID=3708 RepID=A0A078IJC3_BRANA|nr:BnaCnng17480D [Brassica napus]
MDLPALPRALNADEYEELKESNLGVFIKFKELNFGWASRLLHYMLGFHLNIKKKVEVTKEMADLWEMMGVDVDAGPTSEQIKAAFGRCEEWSWDDRIRLGYLAIFTGFIEGRKYSTATRTSLARLVMDLCGNQNSHCRFPFKLGNLARTRSLRSDRAVLARARSLRSDRAGRVLRSDRTWLELGRYVATEQCACLVAV